MCYLELAPHWGENFFTSTKQDLGTSWFFSKFPTSNPVLILDGSTPWGIYPHIGLIIKSSLSRVFFG